VLFGLHAVLELHFDQEEMDEEGYFSLLDEPRLGTFDPGRTTRSGPTIDVEFSSR
jgi:hypothetical protein